jgi:hypothetical protein
VREAIPALLAADFLRGRHVGLQMSLCGRENHVRLVHKRPGHIGKSKCHGPEKHQSGWRANNSGPQHRRLHREDAGIPRASRCPGVDSSRVGRRCSRSDIFSDAAFSRRLLRDYMDHRGRGGKSKDIEVPTQARESRLCWGIQGFSERP